MSINKTKFFIIIKIIFLLVTGLNARDLPYKINTWNINPDTAVSIFLASGKTIKIDPLKQADEMLWQWCFVRS